MLDSSKHKVAFEAPSEAASAVVSIEVLQSVEDEDGTVYTSASSSFTIYVQSDGAGCFNANQPTITDDGWTPPIRLSIHSMFKDGNLTMMFSSPVIVPKLFKDAVVDSQQRKLARNEFSFHDIVELFVISTFHEEGSDATEIEDYQLTRFTERAFDIQVSFKQP